VKSVLTKGSVLKCTHGGQVDTSGAPERWVTIEARSVLCGQDPAGLPIGAAPRGLPICPTPRTNTTKPCERTIAVIAGQSDFVFVDGLPMCLEILIGTTDGLAPAIGVKYSVDEARQPLVRVER
jgi:hypothetical protein